MKIILPASLDIYLLECKTHSSEIRFTKYLINNLESSDIVFDIGTHFGFYSLLMSELIGYNGFVHSFEPSKSTFKVFSDNVKNVNNINANNLAIGNNEDDISFYEFPVLYSEYNSLNKDQYENTKWIEKFKPEKIIVNQTTISSYCKENKIDPKLIKIDVEGNEFSVIEGAKEFLSKSNSIIVMEYVLDKGENYRKATKLLTDLGFKSSLIDNNGSLTFVEDVEKEMKENNSDSENIVFTKPY